MNSDQDELALLAEGSSLEASQIEDFLHLLNAPRPLTRFKLVLENLREILDSGADLKAGVFDLEIPSFVVERLFEALDKWPSGNSSMPGEWSDDSSEPRGIIKAHPEWAMLIFGRDNPLRQQKIFLQHLYIVLHASIHQRSRHTIFGSEVEKGCRAIRKLATGKIGPSTLFPIPVGCSLDRYLRELSGQSESAKMEWSGIDLLIRKVLQDRGKTRFSTHFKRPGSITRRIERRDSDEERPEGPDAEMHLYHALGSTGSQDNARASGLHPGEAEAMQATAVFYSRTAPTLNFSLRDHVRRQAKQVKHISSLNQRLPFRYAQLTNIELACAAILPQELINKMSASGASTASRLDDYVAILLHLLLWLGRPLSQLLEMRIYAKIGDVPLSDKRLLAYVRDEDAFIISIPSCKWRRRLSENDRFLLETIGGAPKPPSEARIAATSPVKIARLITFLAKNKGDLGNNRKHLLFPPKIQDAIVLRLKRVIAEKNRQQDLRLTHLRISQALFDEISRISSDWVDASLLTGHVFTTTEVSAHYYSVSGEYLQQLYHQSAVSLRNRLYSYLHVQKERYYDFAQGVPNVGEHGSVLNVKPQFVVELVKHFKHELRSALRNSRGVAEVHNALVVYIAFWILFATGYRAVNDLIFTINELDWETGFLVISDKDDDFQSHSRIVWLPPYLLAQIRLYIDHLDVLQTKVTQGTTLWLSIDHLRRSPSSGNALMFFIRGENSIVRLTPESLRTQVEGLSLPLNIGRHYLRSRLRQLGCYAEYVNAFLGHWQYGQEPFGPYSTMSPVEMYSNLAPYMEELRKEAGWTVQAGFANG